MTRHIFYTPEALMSRTVRVLLIGAGGTGSEMLDALAHIHIALVALGHPGGLEVTVLDPDTVSATNIGRARFSVHDVGQFKAPLLVHRYNLFYNLAWSGLPLAFEPLNKKGGRLSGIDLLITCVDRARVRVEIAKMAVQPRVGSVLWLDCGNGQHSGQVVLGHLGQWGIGDVQYLPNVYDLFPELDAVVDDAEPSCSMEQALRSQDLFVNRMVADNAGALLWKLLRVGKLDAHGAFVDVQAGTSAPLWIDDEAWAFYGFKEPEFATLARADEDIPY